MSTYFKHTSGESFTLNNNDYSGFFHISGSNIYTGKYFDDLSQPLIPKETFLSDIHQNQIELNTAYKNIDSPSNYYSNVFDLLNKEGLDTLTSTIDVNNLLTFKSLVVDNPFIYNFNPKTNHFYAFPALSSTDLTPQNQTISVFPFTINDEWAFLENVVDGTFIVDSNHNFTYFCSSGTSVHVLSGSFSANTPLYNISEVDSYSDDPELLDYTYSITYDKDENRIVFVNKETIDIYDAANFINCGSLILIDQIKLQNDTLTEVYIWNKTRNIFSTHKKTWGTRFHIYNNNNPEYIKFGKNLRTELYNNVLYLYNKYSSDEIYKINLSDYGVENVLAVDIRNIDDYILVLNSKEDGIYILRIDILDIPNAFNLKIESLLTGLSKYTVKFSSIDSDIFTISNQFEYQTRHISYPVYPTGRLNGKNLLYLQRYKWNTAREPYFGIQSVWNTSKQKSNSYNNLLVSEQSKNNYRYLLLHNSGRIYAIYGNIIDRYQSNIPLDIIKYFDKVECSESSVGLYVNSSLINIVKDCLNLYNQSYGKFQITEDGIEVIPFTELTFNSSNFYIQGNETFNAMTFRRILSLLKETQEKIISST